MLREIALTPDVFLYQSYSSPELAKVYMQILKDPLLQEVLVRNLHDGNWIRFMSAHFGNWSPKLKELIRKLIDQKRIKGFQALNSNLPDSDEMWCHEAIATHAKEALETIITTGATKVMFDKEVVVAEIEKARESIRDGKYDTAITNSISSAESTMRIIHEKTNNVLPNNKTVTDLFKSTRQILKLDEVDKEKVLLQLTNNIHGLVSTFGSLRNSLSDAHGRGNLSGVAQEYFAELAVNISSTLSTLLEGGTCQYK